jgi:hypothetical protein
MQREIIEYSEIYYQLRKNKYFGNLPNDTLQHIVYFVMSNASTVIVQYIHHQINKAPIVAALKQVTKKCYIDGCGEYNSFSLYSSNTYFASKLIVKNFSIIKGEEWFEQYVSDFEQSTDNGFYSIIDSLPTMEEATAALRFFMEIDIMARIISVFEELQLQIVREAIQSGIDF